VIGLSYKVHSCIPTIIIIDSIEIRNVISAGISAIETVLTKSSTDRLDQGARSISFAVSRVYSGSHYRIDCIYHDAHTYLGALLTAHALDKSASESDRVAATR
jgi:hypothetical protein